MPQVPPVLQAAALAAVEAPYENDDPPETLAAKVEILFLTCALWQAGQTTPSIPLALRTSSSNWLPHWLHTNSNKGMKGLLMGWFSYPWVSAALRLLAQGGVSLFTGTPGY
jgi:hypothetical protein